MRLAPDDDGRVSRRTLLLGGAGTAAIIAGAAIAVDYEADRHPGLHQRLFGCGHTPAIPASTYDVTSGTTQSRAMNAELPWSVALPHGHRHGDPLPLVVVLAGRGGSPQGMVDSIGLPGWATAAGMSMCFASPGGAGSTYYHPRADGTDAFSWVTEEFIPLVERRFAVGGSAGQRAVYGSSMGGFGALLVTQQQPELVGSAVASSPAVFPSYHDAITGHSDTFDSPADWATWGVWLHAHQIDRPVRIDCGNADPFASTARALLHRIPGAVGGISSGCHDTGFWRRTAPAQLQFLQQQFSG